MAYAPMETLAFVVFTNIQKEKRSSSKEEEDHDDEVEKEDTIIHLLF